jgi:hypothetical protein
MKPETFNPEQAIKNHLKQKKMKRYKSAAQDFREAHKFLVKVQALFCKHPEGILVYDMIQQIEGIKSNIETLVVL